MHDSEQTIPSIFAEKKMEILRGRRPGRVCSKRAAKVFSEEMGKRVPRWRREKKEEPELGGSGCWGFLVRCRRVVPKGVRPWEGGKTRSKK